MLGRRAIPYFAISLAFLFLPVLSAGCQDKKGTAATLPPDTLADFPDTPADFSVSARNGAVILSWSAAVGATSYNLYWSTTADTGTEGDLISEITTTSYTHTALTNGTTYYYVLTAVNAAGESTPSDEVSATPDETLQDEPPADAPGGLIALAGDESVELRWNAVTDATGYNVYFATEQGFTTASGTLLEVGDVLTYTHTGLTNGTIYYYVVTGLNEIGEGTASEEVSSTPVVGPSSFFALAGESQISLSWVNSLDTTLTSVLIRRSTAGLPSRPGDGTTVYEGTGTNFVDSGLSTGATYYYTLFAHDDVPNYTIGLQASATPFTNGTVGEIAAGDLHVCAIMFNGDVKCWGANADGQLGLEDSAERFGPSANVDLGTGEAARKIVAGEVHTCALLNTGSVKCWGGNDSGQLGQGDILPRGDRPDQMGDDLAAIDLGTGRAAIDIAAGSLHTCALLDNGTVKCWGRNASGQLGQGDADSRGDNSDEMGDDLPAIDLGTGRAATAIAAGGGHTCALLDDGTLKCWGSNASGQLGQGDTTGRGSGANEMGDNLAAINLGSNRVAMTVSAGLNFTCARLSRGDIKCWGDNSKGQLGLGDTTDRGSGANEMGDNLFAINLGTNRVAVAVVAGGEHTCARLNNGQLKCWGSNAFGQLGQGSTSNRGDAPGEMGNWLVAIDVGTDTGLGTERFVVTVATGGFSTCARLDNGRLKCWGLNDNGQLGLADVLDRGDEVDEMGDNLDFLIIGTNPNLFVAKTGSGQDHTCALLDNGTVKCWGLNDVGELGQGDTAHRGDGSGEMGDNLATIDLGTGLRAVDLAVGEDHACVLLANGDVKCWGQNQFGELGVGDTEARGDGEDDFGADADEMGDNLTVVDLGGSNAVSIASSYRHTCALLTDGTVKCWGWNVFGQLGQGDVDTRGDQAGEMGSNLPAIDLGTGLRAVAISAGRLHACARLDNGRVKCWGSNAFGQLGQGDNADRGDGTGEMGDSLGFISLGTGLNPAFVAAGHQHTCAKLTDGTLKCWGENGLGQLGLGDTTDRGDAAIEMGDNLPTVDLGTGRSPLSLSIGFSHTCARLDEGTLKCWGGNTFGQLGKGDTESLGDAASEMGDDLSAIDLGTGLSVFAVSNGSQHTCAQLDDNSLKCWGRNDFGGLGLGDSSDRGGAPGEMGDSLPTVDLGTF